MTTAGSSLRAFVFALTACAAAWGQAGEIRLDVTRDAWISNVGPEADGGNGGSPRLKVKSIQEMTLIDVDASRLKRRIVASAALHLRIATPVRLRRVTVGAIAAPWVEGTAVGYGVRAGQSTHNHRVHPDVPWTSDGGDLCRVILGQGGAVWGNADATDPDKDGWQTIAVDPKVVAARVAGLSEGFIVFDDTGSEWSRAGDAFHVDHFPNRFVFSRESNRSSAPYMTVKLGAADAKPPAAPGSLKLDPAELPAGEAVASWTTPRDEGPAGVIGFFATVDGRPVPRDLLPTAGSVGETVRVHLRDLGLSPGANVTLAVRAVDAAGNVGPAATIKAHVSARRPRPLPAALAVQDAAIARLPRLGAVEAAIIDELDKVDPVGGRSVPAITPAYLAANHLWNAAARRIKLSAARNEFVAFQILIRGDVDVTPSLAFDGPGAAPIVELGRYEPVKTADGWMPDPIVGLDAPSARLGGRTSRSYHVEIYVPHDAPAGPQRGRLTLRAGGETLAIDVDLTVWDFTLPDVLSFLPEMNCYDLPADERACYRLAHRHRTVLNRVPYHHNGAVSPGAAPTWDGRALGWDAWDRRYGPLLDGSAFADLPRKNVPIECLYLPIFENWPTPMEGAYNGDYWADRAFPVGYHRALVEVSRQFAEHFAARKYESTFFQFFLNGKTDFKARGWSRGTSPWLLDEPANFQDYWALRYFGKAFHDGVRLAKSPSVRMVFRCDVSRPQWQRDVLDGLLDYNVVGGAVRRYLPLVLDRKHRDGQIVIEYGTANSPAESNIQAAAWCLDAWTLGLDGVLPWQTIGDAKSWTDADSLALFYPSPTGGAPSPSIRLKAFRRGQQDVEYLTLWRLATAEPRWAVGESVRAALRLAPARRASGEDAGVVSYGDLRPSDLATLRSRIGSAVSAAHPAAKRKLVDLKTPAR